MKYSKYGLRGSETCKPRRDATYDRIVDQFVAHGWLVANAQDASLTLTHRNSPHLFVRVCSAWSNAQECPHSCGRVIQVRRIPKAVA